MPRLYGTKMAAATNNAGMRGLRFSSVFLSCVSVSFVV